MLQKKKTTKNGRKRTKSIPAAPRSYNTSDPVVTSVRAFLRPFDTPKGIASPLDDGRPSQKFMAKAQTQLTIATGQIMAFMFAPCAANDSTAASVTFCIGAASSGNFTSAASWLAVIPPGTVSTLTTNTPYSATVLSTGLEVSCVGAGLKFTYEGTELNRGGTFRYIYDREGSYNQAGGDWSTKSPQQLVNYVNSQANTIRQSINKDNVVEINASNEETNYREVNDQSNIWYNVDLVTGGGDVGPAGAILGKAGLKPCIIGYFVSPASSTVSFHVDAVEHWSIAGSSIQALQTESYAHAPMATHVASVMSSIRQAHATSPNIHHATVASTTVKALRSPLGHELLNAGVMAALA